MKKILFLSTILFIFITNCSTFHHGFIKKSVIKKSCDIYCVDAVIAPGKYFYPDRVVYLSYRDSPRIRMSMPHNDNERIKILTFIDAQYFIFIRIEGKLFLLPVDKKSYEDAQEGNIIRVLIFLTSYGKIEILKLI